VAHYNTQEINDLPGNSPVLRPIRPPAVSTPFKAPERAGREFLRGHAHVP